MTQEVRLGVIGAGGFGLFALQHAVQVPGVRLTAMGGTHREAALATAKRFGVPDVIEAEAVANSPEVDLVYISTPPFLHHPQAMMALRAGKHVICEKPLALTDAQADEMLAEAQKQDVLLVVNLMQRYNPLIDKVHSLIRNKTLGELLHAYFENYASDEGLPPEHWFWDRSKSGGIFIEHGVHFFDLFEGWLGPGKITASQKTLRPGTQIEEQVQCTAKYADGIYVNFYHGFTQPSRMDRQQMRFLFERGDVTLDEWVPTKAHIHAIANEEDSRQLAEIFPNARLNVTAYYAGKDRKTSGRHKSLDVYQLLEMHWGDERLKMHVYGDLVREMFADQVAWLRDRSHERRITSENGRASLAMATAAEELATL